MLCTGPLGMFGAKAEIAVRENGLDLDVGMVACESTARH